MSGGWARSRVHARGLLQAAILRSAALLVPGPQRSEWWREWHAELWHVRGEQGDACATRFCLGAFSDAMCVREAWNGRARSLKFESSPISCLLILGSALATAYIAANLLPGVRAARTVGAETANGPHTLLIQRAGTVVSGKPSITTAQFRQWTGRWQEYFDGLAFYHVTAAAHVQVPQWDNASAGKRWNVGRGTSNFFSLLGLPIRMTDGERGEGTSAAYLSERTWIRRFGADPHVTGTVVEVDGQMLRIAGVAPDASLGLPGSVDIWILDSQFPALPDKSAQDKSKGYVLAHLTPTGQGLEWSKLVRITVSGGSDADEDMIGTTLENLRPSFARLYGFALFLALLALPALTTVSLGESSANPCETAWRKRLVRWAFFATKIGLLMPAIYFASIDLAYGWTLLSPDVSIYLQVLSVFAASLGGLCWALKDQRQRCPVCIRCVTHPAHVGLASRTFLDWNGTEMMCAGGHTLLHVPSLPTSWFSSQRWLYLDASWNFLFAGSTTPLP